MAFQDHGDLKSKCATGKPTPASSSVNIQDLLRDVDETIDRVATHIAGLSAGNSWMLAEYRYLARVLRWMQRDVQEARKEYGK